MSAYKAYSVFFDRRILPPELSYKDDCKCREYCRQGRSLSFSTTMRKALSCLLTPETRCPSCLREEITSLSASSARRQSSASKPVLTSVSPKRSRDLPSAR